MIECMCQPWIGLQPGTQGKQSEFRIHSDDIPAMAMETHYKGLQPRKSSTSMGDFLLTCLKTGRQNGLLLGLDFFALQHFGLERVALQHGKSQRLELLSKQVSIFLVHHRLKISCTTWIHGVAGQSWLSNGGMLSTESGLPTCIQPTRSNGI